MIFVVMQEDKYMVDTPYWNVGTWTHDPNMATVYDGEEEFFTKNYPSFKLVEVDEKMLRAYKKREKERRKEERARLKERRAERDKRTGIKMNYGDEDERD